MQKKNVEKKGLDIKSKPRFINESLSFSGEKITRGDRVNFK